MSRSHTLVRTPRDLGTPIRVEITLEVISDYLHVGAGRRVIQAKELDVDFNQVLNMFLRGDPQAYAIVDPYFEEFNALPRTGDKVVIPGSTVKGAVRTRLEMSIPNSCYIVDRPGVGKSQGFVQLFKPDPNRRSDNYSKGIAINHDRVCPVCDIMGSPGLGSRVSFSDLVMVSGKLGTATIDQVQYELALKGSKFVGSFLVNQNKNEVGAILYGLGIRCESGKVNSRTFLLGRFKFDKPQFGRVKFTAKLDEREQCTRINDFVREFKVKDIWEK